MTRAEAKSLVRKHADAAWAAIDWTVYGFASPTAPTLHWPNMSGSPSGDYYGEGKVIGGEINRATVSGTGNDKHRANDLLVVHVYTKTGVGDEPGDQITGYLESAFRTPPSGIRVRGRTLNTDGLVNGRNRHRFQAELIFDDHG